jgi:hypothetical protein
VPATPPVVTARPRSLDDDRYRVLERRDVRQAVEFEFVFVPAFVALVLLVIGSSNAAFAAAAIAALVALGALAVGWRLGLRRRPHPTAYAIGVVTFAMGLAATTTTETVASLMNGLFAVLVVGCAVWMPWSPRWHAAFLGLAFATLIVGLSVSPPEPVQYAAGLMSGVVAILTSGVGVWMVRRRHLRMWGQALELRRQKAALGRTVAELEAAQHRVRRLEGILPICASCKRIRDGGTWQSVEGYVTARSDAQFSHGICPDCAARLYPDDAVTVSST